MLSGFFELAIKRTAPRQPRGRTRCYRSHSTTGRGVASRALQPSEASGQVHREGRALTGRGPTDRLKENHILLSTDGPGKNVLKFKPPMCFSLDNAQHLVAKLDAILTGELGAGAADVPSSS